jgi:serine/threonine-protein kinase RsbT
MKPPELASDVRVSIEAEADIVSARTRGRALAIQMGFSAARATLLATAISELARNILLYAGHGEVQLSVEEHTARIGIGVVARDKGPGIADLSQALQDGYSSSGRLGLGLPGVRRLMDTFEARSAAGEGTVVVAKMWLS